MPVDVSDGAQQLTQWQDGHSPTLTFRVWLSETNKVSARFEWGSETDVPDKVMALRGAHMTVELLLKQLLALSNVGGEKRES